ncbi:jg536, partial [Pararge aegeria aegeria]
MQTLNPGPSSLRPPSYFTPDAIPGVPYDESNVKNVPIGYDMKPYLSEQTSNVKDDVDKDFFYKPPQTTAKVNENKIIMTDTTTPNAEALPTDKTIFGAQKGDEAYTGTTRVPTQVTPEEAKHSFDLFNPTPVVPKEQKVESRTNLPCSTIPDFATENQPAQRQNDANSVQLEQPHFPSQPSSSSSWFSPVNDSRFMGIPPQGSSAVIPPPPMFSNIPRRDSQTTIEKSVLPPSVARRISGNQPIIKPQAVPMMVAKENFFIPTIPFESETHSQQNMAPSEYSYLPDSQNTAQYLTTDKSECIRQPQINRQTQPIPPENNPQSSFQIPINNSIKSVDLSLPNTSVPMISSNNCTLPGVPPFTQSSFTSEAIPLQIFQLSSEPKHVSDDTVVKSEGDSTPSLFQKSSNERLPNTTDITQQLRHDFGAPSMFTNPATQTSIPKTPGEMQINEETVSQDKFSQFMINSPPQLPKEISEPPKMTGNLNYRLKKKKPQYYSGPIAGVGNISNNVKPILNTMGPSSFQGAIFTPESNEDPTSQKLASDYNVASAHEIASSADLPKPPTGSSSFQGAYFTPDQNVQPCNQKISSDYSLPRAYDGATSFDSNQTTASSYPFNINEPEERKPLVCNAFNTAFDLSRPTTESFDDTQRESKGFGIIGSLKSKLSSIDINKIQNTVTTFFDPAYNNTKSEEKKQEHLTHYDNDLSVGNYRNFPQTENANLEVYIPNEQITPNVYNQHPNSSQPSMHPQYYPSQEYLNQAQNHPNFNYTGWDGTQSGTTNLFPNLHNVMQDSSSRNMPMSLIEVQEMYPNTATFSQDYTIQTASEKPLKEIENEKTAYLSKLTDSASHSSVHKGTTLSENRKEINIEKINAIPDDKGETKISQNTADTFKTFFDYSKEDSQLLLGKNICRDDITDIKNANPEYGHSTTDSFTSALDIKQSFTEPIVQVKGYERISKLHASRAFSNISAKDFFDRQQSQDNLTTSKLQKSYEDNTEQKPHTGYDLLQKTSDISTKSFFEYQLTNPDRDLSNNKVLQSIFSKENTIDFDTSKEILTTVVLPVLKNISEDLVPPQYLDSGINDSEVISSTSFDNKIIGNNDEATKLSKNSYTLFDFGHSDKPSVIHGCAPYKDVKDIEEKLENVSLTGNTESVLNKKSSVSGFFVKGEPIDLNQDFPVHPDSDLNICETCREVNKPEETDGDNLTTHLIENITAPIQLANPVEYPVVETTKVTDETDISYATESIIETMKLPAPVELIENIISTGINYGWSTNIPHSSNVLQDHNYGFQPDPLSLGCFEDKSLLFENIPTNASDEIKAEYRISQDDTPVLPLINMPAAPPEEDSKSDESCLDVHSIEQDAKKDFPIYEEFVIDPSETDDNKIEYKERERSSDDPIPDADTFTNRVERYKKMETNPEPNAHIFELRKDSIPFDLPTSTSPALTIASYFDTGNYAVENHYRNSLTSPLPSTLRSFTVNTSPPMRIPPGFEEEYKRRLSIAAANILPGFNSQNITYVPDTSTQSASIITLTLNPNIAYVPDVSAQIRGLPTLVYSGSPIEDLNISDAEVKTMAEKISSATNERLPAFSNFVEPKEEIVEEQKHKESIEEKPQNLEQPKLETQTDPINFFTSNEESTDDSDAYNNYSRLSSYFSSPPKPDHSKSFFELSQSQDHYRHKTKNDTFDSIQTNVKSFFETAALNNPSNASILNSNNETSNIPHNYMQNMSLVNDLTSCKNFTPPDDVVRTVNYFTIAHNAEYAKENCIGEPKVIVANKEHVKITESKETKNNQLGDVPDNNLNFEDIVSNCKYCCETTKNFTKVDFDSVKVRKVMDRNTDTKREGDCSMDEKKDNVGRKGMSVNFANQTFQEDSSDRIVSIDENRTSSDYDPVKYHWFYHVEFEDKSIWRGFSAGDSKALEDAYNSPDLNEETIVATDGGRFDVNVMGRIRTAVYWADKPSNVM